MMNTQRDELPMHVLVVSVLTSLLLSFSLTAADSTPATLAAPAAADTAFPPFVMSVDGVKVIQDYRPLPQIPGVADANELRRYRDPWGIWRPGIHIRMSILPPEGWTILVADQITATARMDSGDVVRNDPALPDDNGITSDANANFLTDTTNWPSGIHSWSTEGSFGLQLLSPRKPCSSISSLQGTLRVVVGDIRQMTTVHFIPKQGKPQTVPGSALSININANGKIDCSFDQGTIKTLNDVHFYAANGNELSLTSSNSTSNDNHITLTFGTAQPVTMIELHFIKQIKAMMTDFTLVGLPLVSAADRSQLTSKSTACREIPVPVFGVAEAVKPAAPAAKAAASMATF